MSYSGEGESSVVMETVVLVVVSVVAMVGGMVTVALGMLCCRRQRGCDGGDHDRDKELGPQQQPWYLRPGPPQLPLDNEGEQFGYLRTSASVTTFQPQLSQQSPEEQLPVIAEGAHPEQCEQEKPEEPERENLCHPQRPEERERENLRYQEWPVDQEGERERERPGQQAQEYPTHHQRQVDPEKEKLNCQHQGPAQPKKEILRYQHWPMELEGERTGKQVQDSPPYYNLTYLQREGEMMDPPYLEYPPHQGHPSNPYHHQTDKPVEYLNRYHHSYPHSMHYVPYCEQQEQYMLQHRHQPPHTTRELEEQPVNITVASARSEEKFNKRPNYIPSRKSKVLRISTAGDDDYIKMSPVMTPVSQTLPLSSRRQPPDLSLYSKSYDGGESGILGDEWSGRGEEAVGRKETVV